MLNRVSAALIALLVLVTVVAGCSSGSGNTPANLSKAEKEKLIKQLNTTFIDRYPDNNGLVKVYGDIENGASRHLLSATVIATDVVTKGKNTVYGKVVVENVKPGESISFEIVTGRSIDEIGEKVMLSVIDAEFR